MRIEERWPFPTWLVRSALGATALGLLLVLWETWSATSSARTGLCKLANGAPLTTYAYPSEAFVFTAIGAYVAGHLTSRYVVEVRPALSALLGEAAFERRGIVLAVKVTATGFLLVVTILNLYEAHAFATGVWPITYYAWCATAASPLLALAGAGAVSFLIGRWLWVAK
ncbi:MAG TPA: hypothetical protein VJT78_12780 [Candidatus Dormibacteraeota bacterium]|nr:hypothetical protein [Candidatus Dormibacteraeota bacterium]